MRTGSSMVTMNLGKILDEKVVRDFRQLFYEITGLFTSFYFPWWKKGQVDFVPRSAGLKFCQLIKGSCDGVKRCNESDDGVACAVGRLKKPLIAACHAGVTGVAIPVFFRGEFLGTVFAGDFLTCKPNREHFAKICRKLNGVDVDLKALEEAYYRIPVMSRQRIKIALELLSLIVNYIVDRERIIDLQENIYQKQKEIANALGARTELERGLQEKMDEVRGLRKQLMLASSTDRSMVLTEDNDTRRRRIIQEALAFIDSYYAEDITLKDVAEHINLSPSYVSTIFHKEYGCTFIEYLVKKRMEKACELLRNPQMNVTMVSMRVGYYNVSYFSQLFKKLMGMPPGKYRSLNFGQETMQ